CRVGAEARPPSWIVGGGIATARALFNRAGGVAPNAVRRARRLLVVVFLEIRALLPVPASLVRDHRSTGGRQDHGAVEFWVEFSSRRKTRARTSKRRRRHSKLRLVVHRPCGPDRHGWAIHDA